MPWVVQIMCILWLVQYVVVHHDHCGACWPRRSLFSKCSWLTTRVFHAQVSHIYRPTFSNVKKTILACVCEMFWGKITAYSIMIDFWHLIWRSNKNLLFNIIILKIIQAASPHAKPTKRFRCATKITDLCKYNLFTDHRSIRPPHIFIPQTSTPIDGGQFAFSNAKTYIDTT